MLQQLLDGIARAPTAHELKVRVMDQVAAPFGAGSTGLYLFGPDGGVAELHTRGLRDGFTLAYEQLGRGADPILERALRTRAAAHDASVYGEGWTRSQLYRECGGPWQIKHYLCVPIVIAGAVVGTLNLGRRSAAHPFRAREVASATAVCRRIAARLDALARVPERPPARSQATIEDLGRLCADRTHVRLNARVLEAGATRLGDDEARALWEALSARHVTPLDSFEDGERTYVLLQAPHAEPPPRAQLTRRESQVVSRMAAGLATKEIAFELGISYNTVAAALTSARGKLGVRSRVKLVELARRLGIDH